MKRVRYKVSLGTQKRCLAFLLALFLWIGKIETVDAVEDAQERTGSLYSMSAVLMDAESGRVLLGKEEEVMRPMASTTKILTCILALEEGNTDEIVTASQNAAKQPQVHIGMQEGDQYFLGDLLYSLMLESHNDSAVAIAEHLAGSVEAFAEKMNEKAAEIGCTQAHFVTPNGLDDSDAEGTHSISAADLARLMSYCVLHSPKAKEFLALTQTRTYQFQEITGKRSVSCVNHNALLDMVDGAISGKTGFTGDAGYCYVGAVQKDGKTLVVALLGCGWPNHKTYKWADAKQLIAYGLKQYEQTDIWEEPEVTRLLVEQGIPQNQNIFDPAYVAVEVKTKEKKLNLLLSAEEEVQTDIQWETTLSAPVEKGAVIGRICYRIDEEEIASYDLVTTERIEEKTFRWVCARMLETYFHF